MSNPYASREECRLALAAGLTAAVTLAQQVYAHEPHDFSQYSPVVMVNSMGTERVRLTQAGTFPKFFFDIQVFVLYSDSTNSYTEAEAEALIDGIEQQIGVWLAQPQSGNLWHRAEYVGPSRAGYQDVGGNRYRVETISIRLEVYRQ